MRQEMTHFDEEGNARMVDVSDKDVTKRIAVGTQDREGGCADGRPGGRDFGYQKDVRADPDVSSARPYGRRYHV